MLIFFNILKFYFNLNLSMKIQLKDFREKIGEKLPQIPRNNPPQGRTEFESFRDLFTYLAEESEKEKKLKEGEKNDTR